METAWGWTAIEWVALTAIATAVTTLVAGITAFLVLRQLRLAGKQLEAASVAQAEAERPYVVVSVASSPAATHLMDLVIENLGKTPARDVVLSLDPEPVRAKEKPGLELAKAKVFTKPIPLLPPGRVIHIFFDNVNDRHEMGLPEEYEASVSYSNSGGQSWNEVYDLDLVTLQGSMYVEIYGMHHLAKAVREMQKTLGRASILGRRGRAKVEATVEPRADAELRKAETRTVAENRHEQLVQKLLPGTTDPHVDEQEGSGNPCRRTLKARVLDVVSRVRPASH